MVSHFIGLIKEIMVIFILRRLISRHDHASKAEFHQKKARSKALLYKAYGDEAVKVAIASNFFSLLN